MSDKVEQLMWKHLRDRVDKAEEKLNSFLLRPGVRHVFRYTADKIAEKLVLIHPVSSGAYSVRLEVDSTGKILDVIISTDAI
jgi:hypothetical protein